MTAFRISMVGLCLTWLVQLVACSTTSKLSYNSSLVPSDTIRGPQLIVLGIAQDAGYPQADCNKSCCRDLWEDKGLRKMVSCLGVRDPQTAEVFLFDATPDIKDQLHLVKNDDDQIYDFSGIFLTHAHIGHYTGLMQLGREVMGAKSVPVYAMPRMSDFLKSNGPWSLLHENNNIEISTMTHGKQVVLSAQLNVTPLLVPHRDEFSETVGYIISGPSKKILFIPDIDKWALWERDINTLIPEVDFAFLDGTFFRNGEIWGRDMSEIPHPFIEESMRRFEELSDSDKEKIFFIHLNHTNPLLNSASEEYKAFSKTGYNLARELQIINL